MKRFNYTGRKKVLREDVAVRLKGEDCSKPIVDVSVDLKDYGFPENAQVYLESQRQTRFMRQLLGDVEDTVNSYGLSLDEFDDSEGVKFRIKVVDQEEGRLLGVAENVKPYNKEGQLDNNQHSILPVRSVDLSGSGVLWRVDFSDQEAALEIERELGSREQVVRSLLFKGFILPAAMRQILLRVVSEEWDEALSDPSDFSTKWLLFVKQSGVGLPDIGMPDYEDWLDDAVRVLAGRIGVRQQIIMEFESGVWK